MSKVADVIDVVDVAVVDNNCLILFFPQANALGICQRSGSRPDFTFWRIRANTWQAHKVELRGCM